jgi:hypothetical protein
VAEDTFQSAIARVRRAEKHLADLRQELRSFAAQQKYLVSPHIDPETGGKQISAQIPERIPIPSLVGVLIGEICYNFRSSLDHFIFELATIDSGKRQPDTQFPIEFSAKRFEGRTETYLKGVNAAHIAEIERLQPYRGCDWTKRLVGISNQDKHREFAALRGRVTFKISNAVMPDSLILKAPFGDGVDMYVTAATQILLKNGASVIETLDKIKAGVTSTLEAFKIDAERA